MTSIATPEPPLRHKPSRRRQFIIFLLVAGAVALSFLTLSYGLPGSFLIDDRAHITDEHPPDPTPTAIAEAVLKHHSGYLGRPISYASLYLTLAVHGKSPSAFKVENILLHGAVGLLLFWFIGTLLEASPRTRLELSPTQGWTFAALVAAAWLLHPLNVSTVLYIVQRMTVIATGFILLSLTCYVKLRSGIHDRNQFSPGLALGTLLFGILGVLSKEEAALIPAFLLLIEFVLFPRDTQPRETRYKAGLLVAVGGIVPIVLGAAYFLTHSAYLMHDYVMRDFSLSERVATEASIVWQYAQMILLPRLRDMTLYQDGVTILSLSSLPALAAFAAWAAVIAGLVTLRRRYPIVVFGVAFFIASQLLESTVLPLELMFEHRTYLGGAGLLLALGAVGLRTARMLPAIRRPLTFALIIAVSMLGFQQWARARTWSNAQLLLRVTASEHPASSRAASELANQYLMVGQLERARDVLSATIENSGQRATSGLRLHLLSTHCRDETFPARLYGEAEHALKSDPLQAYAISALDSLRQLKRKESCPAIGLDRIVGLMETAAENERTRYKFRFIANANASSTSISAGRLKLARRQLVRALDTPVQLPPVAYAKAGIRLAKVCLTLGDRACAHKGVRKAEGAIATAMYDMPKARQQLEELNNVLEREDGGRKADKAPSRAHKTSAAETPSD